MPREEKFAKALDRGGFLVVAPNQDERDGEGGFERNEFEERAGGPNEFAHDADASASFDVSHDGANEARRNGKPRDDSRPAASGNHGIVQAHAFAAREDNKGLACESFPIHKVSHGERVRFWNDDAKAFVAQKGCLKSA